MLRSGMTKMPCGHTNMPLPNWRSSLPCWLYTRMGSMSLCPVHEFSTHRWNTYRLLSGPTFSPATEPSVVRPFGISSLNDSSIRNGLGLGKGLGVAAGACADVPLAYTVITPRTTASSISRLLCGITSSTQEKCALLALRLCLRLGRIELGLSSCLRRFATVARRGGLASGGFPDATCPEHTC